MKTHLKNAILVLPALAGFLLKSYPEVAVKLTVSAYSLLFYYYGEKASRRFLGVLLKAIAIALVVCLAWEIIPYMLKYVLEGGTVGHYVPEPIGFGRNVSWMRNPVYYTLIFCAVFSVIVGLALEEPYAGDVLASVVGFGVLIYTLLFTVLNSPHYFYDFAQMVGFPAWLGYTLAYLVGYVIACVLLIVFCWVGYAIGEYIV